MKPFDVLTAILLVIGGLSWGLHGLFTADLVATPTGAATSAAQLVYATVGLVALYQVVSLRSIQRRWNVSPARVS